MADYTNAAGAQLLDWTTLDDTGAVPTTESSALTVDTNIGTTLHIDMCHQDANDASTNYAGAIVFVKSGTTDEDWHEFVRLQATGGQANAQVLAAASGSGQANPDRIEVAATANFQTPGAKYFLKDVGTLADSCIVTNKDYVSNDYVEAMDDLVNAYDSSDYLYDIVDQWNVFIPGEMGIKSVKVFFYNTDGDATYACRVRYSQATDLE